MEGAGGHDGSDGFRFDGLRLGADDNGGGRVAEVRGGRGGDAKDIFGIGRIDGVAAVLVHVRGGQFLRQRVGEDAFQGGAGRVTRRC